jgi:hypothetical protein
MVCAIWVAIEIYTEGSAGAFDGLFVRLGVVDAPAASVPYQSPGERAAERLRGAYATGVERAERPEAGQRWTAPGQRTAETLRERAGR